MMKKLAVGIGVFGLIAGAAYKWSLNQKQVGDAPLASTTQETISGRIQEVNTGKVEEKTPEVKKQLEVSNKKEMVKIEKKTLACWKANLRQSSSSLENHEHQIEFAQLQKGQAFCLRQGKQILNIASQGFVIGSVKENKDLDLRFCKKDEACNLPCHSQWVEKKQASKGEGSFEDLDVEDPKMAKEMRRLATLLEEDKLEKVDTQANQWHVKGEVVSCDEG